jgi:hypothetical protein
MTESPFTSDRMFKQYFRITLGRKICVTTTHWDRVDKEVGAGREEEIRDTCCAPDTAMARFLGTQESVWDVVKTLLHSCYLVRPFLSLHTLRSLITRTT